GWTDAMYGTCPDYFTQSPYCPPETAEWLVARGAKNIGFDFFEEYCARLPDFTSEDFPMHRVILGAGVVIMEGLTNLGALPRRRVEFAAPFYKIAGTEGAPPPFCDTVWPAPSAAAGRASCRTRDSPPRAVRQDETASPRRRGRPRAARP